MPATLKTISQVQKQFHALGTDLLLSAALKVPKEFLYTNPHTKLTAAQYDRITRWANRRTQGEPIAYLIGYKYFYGLAFKVTKQVLIPRPETEWLVERSATVLRAKDLGLRQKRKSFLRVLDIGTGSGCIAISILHTLSHSPTPLPLTVVASDISEKALTVARHNAKMHKTTVTFVQSDLFKNIRGTFDLITANLPYVPQGMYELLFHNLKYEPKVAITDGGEVWHIYHRFFQSLPSHLAPGGTVLMEMDDGAKAAMQTMVKQILPTYTVKFIKDLGGLWRFMELHAPK